MGQTLFERLWYGKEVVEFKYTNPAKAKIGCSFTIDAFGLRGLLFTLKEIVEYNRTVNGKELKFADYVLLARPVDGEETWVRMRFMPLALKDADASHTVLVLHKYDEFKFMDELDKALRDDTGELVINGGTDAEEKYWRVNDIRGSYTADISVISDADGNGKVESNEVENRELEYWDFSRITLDEAKQEFVQYLFVELDKDCGMQTMWRGEEVDPHSITVL
jgi:hypothetical protein